MKETIDITLEELIKTYNNICQIYETMVNSPKVSKLTKSFVRGMIKEDISQEEQKAIKYTLKLKNNEMIDAPFEFKIVTVDGIERIVHLYLIDKDIKISTIECDGLFKKNRLSKLVILISKQVFTMELEDNETNRKRIISNIVELFLSIIQFVSSDQFLNNLSDKEICIAEFLSNIFLLGTANRYNVKDFYKSKIEKIEDSINDVFGVFQLIDTIPNKLNKEAKIEFYKELSEKMDYEVNYIVNNYGNYSAPEISQDSIEAFIEFIEWYNFASYIYKLKSEEEQSKIPIPV